MTGTSELITKLDADLDRLDSSLKLLAGLGESSESAPELYESIMDHDATVRPLLVELRETVHLLRGKIRGPE